MKNNFLHTNFAFLIQCLLLVMLLSNTTIYGQPAIQISPAIETVDVGESFSMDVLSKSFTNIESMQFSLMWDPDVMEFDTFYINLPAQVFANFNDVEEGRFSIIWVPVNITTIADNTPIINAHFTGIDDGASSFKLSNVPTVAISNYIENGEPVLDVPLTSCQNGTITVGVVSVQPDPDSRDFQLYQNYPNPFSENTSIPFDLKQSEKINLTILDITGKILFQYSNTYGEGTHHITIDKEVLPHPGIYLYEVQTSNELLIKKMILVK